ncbi:MAG: hypothetical protein K2H70_02575 [Bacteroidales bacterium]|nr:hypothetical protein [Bacteroidales bacterium]
MRKGISLALHLGLILGLAACQSPPAGTPFTGEPGSFEAASCEAVSGEPVSAEPTAFAGPDTLWRNGDLVFRCGRSVASDLVLLCEDEPTYSHVGLLARGQDGGWLVVHAAPDEADERGRYDKVMAEPPADFFRPARCRAGGVYRLPVSDTEAARLAAEALRQAGEGRPFDHRFDERDTTAFYCTELIHFLFGKIGIDPTQGRRTRDGLIPFTPPLILPGHLLAHPDLRTVWRFPATSSETCPATGSENGSATFPETDGGGSEKNAYICNIFSKHHAYEILFRPPIVIRLDARGPHGHDRLP